jgi:hypothetical protein
LVHTSEDGYVPYANMSTLVGSLRLSVSTATTGVTDVVACGVIQMKRPSKAPAKNLDAVPEGVAPGKLLWPSMLPVSVSTTTSIDAVLGTSHTRCPSKAPPENCSPVVFVKPWGHTSYAIIFPVARFRATTLFAVHGMNQTRLPSNKAP